MRAITLGFGRFIVKYALRPFVKVEYRDEANGVRLPGIYVCNHRSASDPFLVSMLDIEAVQIVKGWPMKLPFLGFSARKAGYIDSSKTTPEQYAEIFKSIINRGVSIIVFPEGTRSGSRNMNPFFCGVFKLARQIGIPLYPCCIVGNEFFPDRSFMFHKTTKIIIKRLQPVMPENFNSYRTARIFKRYVSNLIRNETEALDSEIDHLIMSKKGSTK